MEAAAESLRLALGVCAVAAAAIGYGVAARRCCGYDSNLAADGAAGMAILTALFMVEHFFVPLQQPVALAALLPGLIAFLVFFRRNFIWELLLIAAVTWWTLQISRTGLASYDHSLYHLQSAIWNTLDRAIPGITNLHTRLGFDSTAFVLGAGLHLPDFGGWKLAFLGTAILEAMVIADLLLSLRGGIGIVQIYSLTVLVCVILQPRWLLDPSYMSPDPVLALGVVYSVFLFLAKRSWMLWIWVPFLITVKLAATPLLLLLGWNRSVLKTCKVAAALGVLILTVWVARNIVLSGHLLYPIAATKLPLPWAERNERTLDTAAWIVSWARDPGKSLEETSGFKWVKPWLLRTIGNERARASAWMAIAGFFLLLWNKGFKRIDSWLVFSLGAALIFWFLTAPEMRFGMGFTFATGFLVLAYGMDSLELIRPKIRNPWALIAVLAAVMDLTCPRQIPEDWPMALHPFVRLATTPAGGKIWEPILSDQCWDVIPCSPEAFTIEDYPKRALKWAPTE